MDEKVVLSLFSFFNRTTTTAKEEKKANITITKEQLVVFLPKQELILFFLRKEPFDGERNKHKEGRT